MANNFNRLKKKTTYGKLDVFPDLQKLSFKTTKTAPYSAEKETQLDRENE